MRCLSCFLFPFCIFSSSSLPHISLSFFSNVFLSCINFFPCPILFFLISFAFLSSHHFLFYTLLISLPASFPPRASLSFLFLKRFFPVPSTTSFLFYFTSYLNHFPVFLSFFTSCSFMSLPVFLLDLTTFSHSHVLFFCLDLMPYFLSFISLTSHFLFSHFHPPPPNYHISTHSESNKTIDTDDVWAE